MMVRCIKTGQYQTNEVLSEEYNQEEFPGHGDQSIFENTITTFAATC